MWRHLDINESTGIPRITRALARSGRFEAVERPSCRAEGTVVAGRHSMPNRLVLLPFDPLLIGVNGRRTAVRRVDRVLLRGSGLRQWGGHRRYRRRHPDEGREAARARLGHRAARPRPAPARRGLRLARSARQDLAGRNRSRHPPLPRVRVGRAAGAAPGRVAAPHLRSPPTASHGRVRRHRHLRQHVPRLGPGQQRHQRPDRRAHRAVRRRRRIRAALHRALRRRDLRAAAALVAAGDRAGSASATSAPSP